MTEIWETVDPFPPVSHFGSQCKIRDDKSSSGISRLPVFGSLNLFTEDCGHYLMTSDHISGLGCKGQMIESAVGNTVGSAMN